MIQCRLGKICQGQARHKAPGPSEVDQQTEQHQGEQSGVRGTASKSCLVWIERATLTPAMTEVAWYTLFPTPARLSDKPTFDNTVVIAPCINRDKPTWRPSAKISNPVCVGEQDGEHSSAGLSKRHRLISWTAELLEVPVCAAGETTSCITLSDSSL